MKPPRANEREWVIDCRGFADSKNENYRTGGGGRGCGLLPPSLAR